MVVTVADGVVVDAVGDETPAEGVVTVADGVVVAAVGAVTVKLGLWHIGEEQPDTEPLESNFTNNKSTSPAP